MENQTRRIEYITLSRQTSITQLRALCGWDRERQPDDYDLVGWGIGRNYELSRIVQINIDINPNTAI